MWLYSTQKRPPKTQRTISLAEDKMYVRVDDPLDAAAGEGLLGEP